MDKRKYFRINDDSDYPISLLDHELDMGAVLSISQAQDVINELQAVIDQIAPIQTLYELRAAQDPLIDGKMLDEMVVSIFTAVAGMRRHYGISYDPQLATPRLGMYMTVYLLNGVAENVEDIAKAAGTFEAPIARFVNHTVITAEMFYEMIYQLEKAINATPNYKAVVSEI